MLDWIKRQLAPPPPKLDYGTRMRIMFYSRLDNVVVYRLSTERPLLTQAQLAHLWGVSISCVSQMEGRARRKYWADPVIGRPTEKQLRRNTGYAIEAAMTRKEWPKLWR